VAEVVEVVHHRAAKKGTGKGKGTEHARTAKGRQESGRSGGKRNG